MSAAAPVPAIDRDADLDSHFRYLSGLLLALGLTFWSTVPRLGRAGWRFRLAAAITVCGGLGRLLSLVEVGWPTLPHLVALALELGVVPALVLWQWHVSLTLRRIGRGIG